MPTTALTITNQLLSTTAFSYQQKLTSVIDEPLRYLANMEKLGKEEEEGGERMVVAWNFTRHSSSTR